MEYHQVTFNGKPSEKQLERHSYLQNLLLQWKEQKVPPRELVAEGYGTSSFDASIIETRTEETPYQLHLPFKQPYMQMESSA